MTQLELPGVGDCRLNFRMELEMPSDWDSGFPFDLLTLLKGMLAIWEWGRVVKAEYKFGEGYEPHDWTEI